MEGKGELVRAGVPGCLVREHDVDGVVAAIDGILDDGPRAAAMGARAKQAAFARHDERQTSRIKQACYAELLAR